MPCGNTLHAGRPFTTGLRWPTVPGNVVDLCPLAGLAPGCARGFDPFGRGRDSLFVVRRSDRVVAYRNVCPHQGSSLPWRKNAYLNADGSKIVCHAHGAEFDVDTGACTLGAALGHSLDPVEVWITNGGMIQARLEDEPGADDR